VIGIDVLLVLLVAAQDIMAVLKNVGKSH